MIHNVFLVGLTLVCVLEVPGVLGSSAVYNLEEYIVADVCTVQCESLCYDIGETACEPECGGYGQKQRKHANAEWILQCERASSEFDCIGRCSSIHAEHGYIPVKPEVRVIREAGRITLSWDRDPLAQPNTLYIVAQKDGHSWKPLGWVHGEHYRITYNEMCGRPQFKVAAVSRYGSRWFSKVVRAPAIQPGPSRNATITRLVYRPTLWDRNSIDFTVQWMPPEGWSVKDILDFHVYSDPSCYTLDPVYARITNLNSKKNSRGEDVYVMTGQIPTRGVGCNITFLVRAVSKCLPFLEGSDLEFSIDLNCKVFPNFEVCQTPPAIYPGLVRNVKLTLIPLHHGVLGLVSWFEPTNLGSAGRVENYHLTWGIVDFKEFNLIFSYKTVLGHMVVPGNQFSADLYMNATSLKDSETIGVSILAAAPKQQVDPTNGVITLASNTVTFTRLKLFAGHFRSSARKDGSWHTDWHSEISCIHCNTV